jgi:hypothetical protein
VLRDRILFGFDSGIARGGLGIFNPESEGRSFIFLKWVNDNVKYCQMNELKLLSNGIWVSTLGTPQAVVVSRNLNKWFPLHIEGFEARYNYNMYVVEVGGCIACCTGNNIVVFSKDDVKEALDREPVVVEYRDCMDRVEDLAYKLKRVRLFLR